MRRSWKLLAVPLALVACQDAPLSFEGRAQLDGHVQEIEGPAFYWLPPLGAEPANTGVFNPDLYPLIEVCDTAVTGCPVVAVFRRDATDPAQSIVMDAAKEQYQADWKTNRVGTFRVTVYRAVGAQSVLGETVVTLVPSGNVNGTSNVPLKFRVDMLCPDSEPYCAESFVNTAPTDVVLRTPDGHELSVLSFPEDPTRTTTFYVVMSSYTGPKPCLPVAHPQYAACVKVEAFEEDGTPYTAEFEVPAVIYQCIDAPSNVSLDQVHLWKWDGSTQASVTRLERSGTDRSVDCPTGPIGPGAGAALPFARALQLAGALLRPVTGLFSPTLAYADVQLPGYRVSDLSRIGWVQELYMEILSAASQTAQPGAQAAEPLSVRVRSANTGDGIDGVPVRFQGAASSQTVTTSGGGYAATPWTAPATRGEVATVGVCSFNFQDYIGGYQRDWTTMTCDTPEPFPTYFPVRWSPFAGLGRPDERDSFYTDQPLLYRPAVTFTVKAAPYTATFLSPLGTSNSAPNVVISPLPTVQVLCIGAAALCPAGVFPVQLATELKGGSYQTNWTSPSNLVPGDHYRIRVVWNGYTQAEVTVRGVAGGTKTKEPFTFEFGRTLPVKFTVQ
jgi:hypothetical protein